MEREYVLRVASAEDARLMQEIARYVDGKMRAFRRSHPDRPELTTAVVTAMAIAEELFVDRQQAEGLLDAVARLEVEIDETLGAGESGDE